MEQLEQPEKSQGEIKQEKAYKGARLGIAAVFKTYSTGRDRVDYLKSNIENLTFLKDINLEETTKNLEECADINDKEEFIEAVFNALKPITDLKIKSPELFIPKDKKIPEFVYVNEALSYQMENETITIHIVPEEKIEKLLTLFKDGLKKLAEIIEKNKDIKTIEADSWIIALHPKIAEKFGFILDNQPQPGDVNKIYKARMTREDFLEKYLSPDK